MTGQCERVTPIHQVFKWQPPVGDSGADYIKSHSTFENCSLYPYLIRYPSGMKDIADAHEAIISSFMNNRISCEYDMRDNMRYGNMYYGSQVFHVTDDDSYLLAFFYNPEKIRENEFIQNLEISINGANFILSKLGNSNRIQSL